MKTISVINPKGGVGKSMISCNLAVAYALKGLSVVLIDTDHRQATGFMFRALRAQKENLAQFSSARVTAPTLHLDLKTYAADIVIIDGAKDDTEMQRNSMRVANLIVIPFQPSAADMWATENVFKSIGELRSLIDNVNPLAVMNRVRTGTKMLKESSDVQMDIEKEYGIPFAKNYLCDREAYKRTFAVGCGVLEGEDSRAKAEFKKIFDEINKALKGA